MEATMKRIKLRVPATTANLGPGFDSLGLALGLYNVLEVEEWGEEGLHIDIHGEGKETLPRDETNVVAVALRRVYERCGRPCPGLRIRQDNRIPLTRGLGSSAAARVGGLAAANHLAGANLSATELLTLATELEGHPDNVVPALVGGFTVSILHEGRVAYLRAEPPPELRAILAVPDFELPTELARSVLPDTYSRADAVHNLGHAALVAACLLKGEWDLLPVAMEDRLHQPYRLPLIPGGTDVFRAAREAGALGVAISGAGPTLLALAVDHFEDIRAAMQAAWEAHRVNCQVYQVAPDPAGLQVLEQE